MNQIQNGFKSVQLHTLLIVAINYTWFILYLRLLYTQYIRFNNVIIVLGETKNKSASNNSCPIALVMKPQHIMFSRLILRCQLLTTSNMNTPIIYNVIVLCKLDLRNAVLCETIFNT